MIVCHTATNILYYPTADDELSYVLPLGIGVSITSVDLILSGKDVARLSRFCCAALLSVHHRRILGSRPRQDGFIQDANVLVSRTTV